MAWAGGVREGLHAQVGQGAGAQGGSAALSLCTWRRCLDAVPFGSSLRRGSCQWLRFGARIGAWDDPVLIFAGSSLVNAWELLGAVWIPVCKVGFSPLVRGSVPLWAVLT